MPGATKTSVGSIRLSEELKAFCKRLGITKYVPVVLRTIDDAFPSATQPKLYPECDPETGEEWLVIEITVKGRLEEVHEQYQQYTRKKVQSIPWPQVDAIRLLHRFQSV